VYDKIIFALREPLLDKHPSLIGFNSFFQRSSEFSDKTNSEESFLEEILSFCEFHF
jgi:hypothetical protein